MIQSVKSYTGGFLSLLVLPILLITQPVNAQSSDERVYTGIEVLARQDFKPLQGKKVGLITNPTGVNYHLESTIDLLHQAPEVELVALYGPEHGVRGDYDAGEKVEQNVDEKTGVPVYSLYGQHRKPTQEMLDGLDVLVYDIQDIGVRSYTYISTMGLAMEAAAEAGIEVMVLDRPNPLGGNRMEGSLVEEGYYSFVSQFEIPYIYGMTSGELAKMLNQEGMLEDGKKCDLTVIPMENWKRSMTFPETGLPWVPTSPHIPRTKSALYYAATGVMGELGIISEGVGYTLPFETYAAEWIDSQEMADAMNALDLPGVRFRPITFKPFYGRHEGKRLHGVQIHIQDAEGLDLMAMQFKFMDVHNELYPDKNPFEMAKEGRLRMFDKVAGTDRLRKLFTKNMDYEDIRELMNEDIEAFRKKAEPYFIYD